MNAHDPSPPRPTSRLALKVPPLALVVLCGLLMAALPGGASWASAGGAWWGAGAVALAGAGICLAGVVAFRRARTTVDPVHPGAASSLVVRGIYRFTRNPMYLGFLLVLIAWALVLGTLSGWAGPPLFVLYLNRFQIGPEEAALRVRFGAAFEAYTAQVRRWI